MRRHAIVALAVLAAACTQSRPNSESTGTVQWDSTAANEARASVQKAFDGLAAMDVNSVTATVTQDGFLPTFDVDLENKPVRMGTRDEAVNYVTGIIAEVKKMNATMKLTSQGTDCRATATFGVCTIEYDFSATMPDGKTMSQPSRMTIALAKGADGWKWIHWHSSLSSATPAAGAK